jgi:hypothetical protein
VKVFPNAPHRAIRSQVLEYDDQSYKNTEAYTFDPLPPSKKRIRLLQLLANTLHSPSIHCRLVEADYDNTFHIPTRTMSGTSEAGLRRIEIQKIKDSDARLEQEHEWVQAHKIEYEALSWCWGRDDPEHAVLIEKAGVSYKMKVRRDLALALKYLRYSNKVRYVVNARVASDSSANSAPIRLQDTLDRCHMYRSGQF